MSEDRQMDLFDDYAAPTAKLFRFPLASRRRLIVRTADTLVARKTEQGQQSFWTRTIDALEAEIRRYGADQNEVDRELASFHQMVAAELRRRGRASGTPRGAA